MHSDGNGHDAATRHSAAVSKFPLLSRFAGKLVLDILPAALASVIGGFLFTQYHTGRAAPPPATEETIPASPEVLALVREEHEAIVGYLKAQLAAEKSRLAAQDEDTARAVADAKAVQDSETREKALTEQNPVDTKLAAAVPARHVASAIAKVVLPRVKPAAVPNAATATQVAMVESEQPAQQTGAPADRLARDPDSLLAKTLDLKDHVVAATKQAVAVLGDMFASVGERIGGSAPARQFSSDS
jgi:hypothetical protein